MFCSSRYCASLMHVLKSAEVTIELEQEDFVAFESEGSLTVRIVRRGINSGPIGVIVTTYTYEEFQNLGFSVPEMFQNIDPAECKYSHFYMYTGIPV